MLKKPSNLIYGVEENPPHWVTGMLGLQHVFIQSVYFIFPIIIIDSMGGTPEQLATMIKMSMIGMGLTTVLQAFHKGPVGSGYLCPSGTGPAYLSASIMAAQTGGLSLVCGMTMVGGLFEALFSRVLARMRSLFPPEVAGLVVMMVGMEIIPLSMKRFFAGTGAESTINAPGLIVALTTFASMVIFSVWGKGKLRLFPVVIGMVTGYGVSYLFGILDAASFETIARAPMVSFPSFASFGWSFNVHLLLPFLIATVSSSLKDIGDITTCQMISDSQWKRPEMKSISKGILADSIGDILSGFLGALGQSTSSSNVGLSVATGATSRRIAYTAGCMLCVLAFFPKVAGFFVIMPKPVMGAILVYVANFMILAGIKIISTRMIDTRKTFVIATSLIFGLSVDFLPGIYHNVHPLLSPVFSSSLSLSTVLVILLNVLLRIGVSKKQVLVLEEHDKEPLEKISNFMESQGANWGARHDLIRRAVIAMSEFMETAIALKLAAGSIVVDLNYNEMSLEVTFNYTGSLVDFQSSLPTESEITEKEEGTVLLSTYLIGRSVDRLKSQQKGERCRVSFHFDQ